MTDVVGAGGLPQSSGFMSFSLALESQRAEFIRSITTLGVPFAAVARLRTFTHPAQVFWAAVAWYTLVTLAIALLLAWGVWTCVSVRPRMIGTGILFLVPAFCLVVIAFFAWRARGWRLHDTAEDEHRSTVTSTHDSATLAAEASESPTSAAAHGAPTASASEPDDPDLLLAGNGNCLARLAAAGTRLLRAFARRVSWIPTALGVALMLFTMYELSIIFNGDTIVTPASTTTPAVQAYVYSYLATTWMFITWNMLLVMFAVHALLDPPRRYNLRTIIAAALHSRLRLRGTRSRSDEADLLQRAHESFVGNSDSRVPAENVAPATGCARVGSIFTKWPAHVRRGALWYALSICVLAAYIGVNVSLSDGSADSGRYLCFPTVAMALLLDACAAWMFAARMVSTPGSVCFTMAGARIALIAYGTRYWLLGHATVYAIIGLYLAHRAAQRAFLLSDDGTPSAAASRWHAVLHGAAAAPTAAVRPAQTIAANLGATAAGRSEQQPARAANRCTLFLLTPVAILLGMSLAFILFIAGLAIAMNRHTSTLPNPSVPTVQGAAPQYAFAVGAVCLVVVALATEFSVRLYLRGGKRWTGSGWVLPLLTWVACIGCGVALWAVIGSWILLFIGIWAPPAAIATLSIYGQWARDDFVCILPGGMPLPRFMRDAGAVASRSASTCFARCARRTPAQGSAPSTPAAAQGSAPSAPAAVDVAPPVRWFSVGNVTAEQNRNAAMFVALLVMLGSLAAFGACVSATVQPGHVGWTIAAGVAVPLLTAAPIIQWFQTLEFSWFQPTSLVLAAALHAAIHGSLFSTYAGQHYVTLGLAFSMCLYPSVVLLLTAVYKWWDDHWKPGRFVLVTLTASQLIILGFAAAAVGVFESVVVPAAILGGYFALSLVAALVGVWIVHDYFLPRRWVWVARGAIAFVVAGGVTLCVFEYVKNGNAGRAVLWFSLAYWTITLTAAVLGASRLRAQGYTIGISGQADSGASVLTTSAAQPRGSSTGMPSTRVLAVQPRGAGAGGSADTVSAGPDARSVIVAERPGASAPKSNVIVMQAVPSIAAAPTLSQHRLYFASTFFPIHHFDPATGGLRQSHSAAYLLLLAGGMALVWGCLAMVFVVPIYAGVMVTNVTKLLLAMFISNAVRSTQAGLHEALDALAGTADGLTGVTSRSAPSATALGQCPLPAECTLSAVRDAMEISLRIVREGSNDAVTTKTTAFATHAPPHSDEESGTAAAGAAAMPASAASSALSGTDLPESAFSYHAIFRAHAIAQRAWHVNDAASIYCACWPAWSLLVPCLPSSRGSWSNVLRCRTADVPEWQQGSDGANIHCARGTAGTEPIDAGAAAPGLQLSHADARQDRREQLADRSRRHGYQRGSDTYSASSMPPAAPPSMLVLRKMLQDVAATDTEAASAAAEEHLLLSLVLHHVTCAGDAAEAAEFAHWRGFLDWLADPAQQPLLDGADLRFMGGYFDVLRAAQSGSSAPVHVAIEPSLQAALTPEQVDYLAQLSARHVMSKKAMLKHWEHTFGVAAAATMQRNFDTMETEYLHHMERMAAEAERRRKEDEEAAARRAAEDRRRAEEHRRLQDEAALREAHERELRDREAALARQREEHRLAEEKARAEAVHREEEERRRRMAEAEAEAQRLAELAAQARAQREAAEAEQRRRAQEAAELARKKAEEEHRRLEAEAAQRARKLEEERRAAMEAAAEAARREAEHRAAELARQQREAAEAAARAEAIAAQQKAAAEAAAAAARQEAQRKADELARKQAEEEAVRKRAAEEARRRAAELEAQRRAAEAARLEAEAAQARELQRRQREAEEARKRAEEAMRLAQEQAAARARAEAVRQRQEQEAAEAAARSAREAAERLRREQEREAARQAALEAERLRSEAAAREAEKLRVEQEREAARQAELEEQRRKEQDAAAATLSTGMDAELSASVAAIERIIEQHKKTGKRFEDTEFRGVAALGKLDDTKAVGPWKPVSTIGAEPDVVIDGYNPADIKQGMLGDCWLLSAFAVLAAHPEHLDRILLTKKRNEAGVYGVRWWKNGGWVDVLVDDSFPTQKNVAFDPSDGSLYSATPDPAKGMYYYPAFVKSKSSREFWMMILEKAYAKYYGSYAAIEGGLVHTALCDAVAGSVGLSIDMTDADSKAAIRSGALWKRVKGYADSGFLLGAGSPSGSDRDVSAKGIVQGHAYSLLKCIEESDASGSYQLLQLRNPWGGTEWKGKWSDSDKSSWTRRMRNKLEYDPDTSGDDGVFWMSWADFTVHFSDIYVCRIFKTIAEGGSWYKYTAKGAWKGKTAGGCTNSPETAQWNPQYYLQPSTKANVFVQLMQHERRNAGTRDDLHAIGLKIVKKGGKRVRVVYSGEAVLSASYCATREVSAEGALIPAGAPYTLFVSTFGAGEEADFTVTVYSDVPLENTDGDKLRLIPTTVQAE